MFKLIRANFVFIAGYLVLGAAEISVIALLA